MDRSYVVCMKNFAILANSLPCFEFFHPNRQNKSNERHLTLGFKILKNVEVNFKTLKSFENCV